MHFTHQRQLPAFLYRYNGNDVYMSRIHYEVFSLSLYIQVCFTSPQVTTVPNVHTVIVHTQRVAYAEPCVLIIKYNKYKLFASWTSVSVSAYFLQATYYLRLLTTYLNTTENNLCAF